MADTLEIFGVEYTNVAGIIATTPNETDLTYIRPQGTKNISANGTGIDVAEYASVNVNVPSGQPNLQSKIKTYTPTELAQTETVSADSGYDGLYEVSVSVGAISSTYVGTGITRRSATDMSGAYDKDIGNYQVSAPAGYYSSESWFTVPNGTIDTPTATKGTVSNHSVSITPSVFHHPGYIHGGIEEGTAVTVSASELASGNKSITENGTDIDVVGYSTVSVNVPSGSPTIQSLSITPTTSQQTFNASDVDGYKPVTVAAMPTMTLPTTAASSATSGYTSKATIGRSTAAQYINIPPGYNSAGAYYVISAVANGSATAPASISGTAASVSTGNGTLTLTKTVSVTPSVTAGYVSSGTAGNSSVSLTASVTIDPTPTASGATVTIPAGYYSAQTTKLVTTMTLPTSASSSATSGYTKKATISRSTSTQYINIAPGYNSAGGYYEISAVANGSATGPSSLSGSSATVSTGTNTLTLTKTGVTTTPTVTVGYVSSATASTATVTLTASVTTKAAATITPTTTNQTIAAGTYLTGTQTIAGDADLVGSNILSTANIFGVQGTVDFIDVYIRSAAPTSSVGNDGDIYIQEQEVNYV